MTRYRRDIDGLRALAVASVVLFHAGFGVVPGGFVGVDVFFVISGYLITANLHGDLLEGRFSIAGFYERRARRILPALFVMMTGAALGAAFFLPDDLKMFSESVVAAVLSLSNLFFFRHTGYFDTGATISPLLPYLVAGGGGAVLPRLPAVPSARRAERQGTPRRLIAVMAIAWLASFGFSLWQVAEDQRAAFYLPFDRAWELLTGSLLATGLVDAPRRRWVIEAGGAAGLALVLGAALFMPSTASFPGLNAVAPCLGVALVIWAGAAADQHPSWASRLLQLRPFVFIGLISYSLYLWHWPLLVFARYYSASEPGWLLRAAVVALACALATLSWWFVERPFRTRKLLGRRSAVFGAWAAASAVAALCGGAVALAQGLPQRLSPRAAVLAGRRR